MVGGYNYDLLHTVEVVDLAGNNTAQNCSTSLPDYPIAMAWGVGAMVDGRPTVCGGQSLQGPTGECFQYLHGNSQWVPVSSLQTPRAAPASSLVDSETWLVTGGWDSQDATNSSEAWQWGGGGGLSGHGGPDLPLPLSGHCQLTVNSSQVMMLGGGGGSGVHVLDWGSGEWLAQLPDVPTGLSRDACGLIENSQNGREVVVLGNSTDVHLFNFRNGTWRDGPDLEGEDLSASGAAVQMGERFVGRGGPGAGGGGATPTPTLCTSLTPRDTSGSRWPPTSRRRRAASSPSPSRTRWQDAHHELSQPDGTF